MIQRSAALLSASVAALISHAAMADDAQIARGEYLVTIAGCNDCHTPGYFFGNPDASRFLGGSDVGFEIPGLGVFVGPNLTPDEKTGIGSWTPEQIVAAIQTGQRPDGRTLAPIMPWHAFANLTADDAMASRDVPARASSRSRTKSRARSSRGKRCRPSCSESCRRAQPRRPHRSEVEKGLLLTGTTSACRSAVHPQSLQAADQVRLQPLPLGAASQPCQCAFGVGRGRADSASGSSSQRRRAKPRQAQATASRP